MRRVLLLLGLAFMLVSGVVVTTAQTGTDVQTEEEDPGGQAGVCASPVASPAVVAEASPSLALASTPVSHMTGTPVALDACATPEIGTPES